MRQGKFREVKLARQQKSKLEHVRQHDDRKAKVHEVNIVLSRRTGGSVEASPTPC